MLIARCKLCNTEIISNSKIQCCGCPNQMIIKDDIITAIDLSKVMLIKSELNLKNNSVLTKSDLEYQENRRKRKVRKLDFEIK